MPCLLMCTMSEYWLALMSTFWYLTGTGMTPVTSTFVVTTPQSMVNVAARSPTSSPGSGHRASFDAVRTAVIVGSCDVERVDVDARVGRSPLLDRGTVLFWSAPKPLLINPRQSRTPDSGPVTNNRL